MSLGHGASIVRDGLVLHYDPANTKSYSGTGTTIVNLLNDGNDATLGSSGSFSTDNGGIFSYSTTGSASVTNSVQNVSSSQVSAMTWVQIDQFGNWHRFISNNWVNSGWLLYSSDTYWVAAIAQSGVQTDSFIPHNNSTDWTHLALIYDATAVSLYVNGLLVSTNSNSPNAILDTGYAITISDDVIPGTYKIANTMVYNRALSTEEVLQNFNATRGRYGI